MEVTDITGTQIYFDFFCQSLLEDIPYWQCYLEDDIITNDIIKRKREQIIRNIQFALDLEQAWQPLQSLIHVFSPYMEHWGYWKQWQDTLEYALKMARFYQDKVNEVKLSALLARLTHQQSRFQDTVANYRQVIRGAYQIGDLENRARAYSNLGFFYGELGYWWRAEVLCCHALAIFEELNYDHGRAHTANHLGLLYIRLGLWDQASQHLERACVIWQAMDDHHGLMYGFMNLGLLYLDRGSPAEALDYSTRALHQARLTGEESDIGKIYGNMGLAYQLQGELSLAEKYTRQAEMIFRRFFNLPGLADTLEALGSIYLELGQYEEALAYLKSSLEGQRTINHKHDEIQVLSYLAQLELTRGNQTQAMAWLKEAEEQLSQYPRAGQFYQLQAQLEQLRRSLTERVTSQAATDQVD